MTAPVVFAGQKAYVAAAPETSYGTAVTPPTYFWPSLDPKLVPHQTNIPDDALRGNMGTTQAMVAGTRYDELTFDTYGYYHTLFPFMRAILGGAESITGTAAPYTHTVSLLNTGSGQPPSWTLYWYNGAEAWQLAGAVCASLEVTISPDGLVKLTPSWQGLVATKVSDPTPSWPTEVPMAAWNTTVTLAGAGVSSYSSVKLSMKRNDAAAKFTLGTQSPYVQFVGGLEVTGEIEGVYQGYGVAPDDQGNYFANTQPILTVKTHPVGDATHYAEWDLSKIGYTSSVVESDSGLVAVKSEVTGIVNATDGSASSPSPLKYTQVDTVAAYT